MRIQMFIANAFNIIIIGTYTCNFEIRRQIKQNIVIKDFTKAEQIILSPSQYFLNIFNSLTP